MSLRYGQDATFVCEIEAERLLHPAGAPESGGDPREQIRAALNAPLDFPPLAHCAVDGDRVVIALDHHTPAAATIVAEVWNILRQRGIDAQQVVILQPFRRSGKASVDPRSELPADVREQMAWRIHDPDDEQACAYLATTSTGQRVYLARELVDAELVVSVGQTAFDPILGYRGTGSVFYPGLSNREAIENAVGQGHQELGPDDDRPLRQLVDEVSWLLGTPFTIQVLAAPCGEVAAVFAGATESVFRRAKEQLSEDWKIQVDRRAEVVVVSIDTDAAGHGWEQFGAALATARRLVTNGGRIIVLSELDEPTGPGLRLIQSCGEASEALMPLRKDPPVDLIAATELARTVDWARVYLVSHLDSQTVDDLFMFPIDDPREVNRLLASDESCLLIESAQNVFAQVD